MKPTSPQQILSDQLLQLHRMETHIARELPILAGSVMNARLRGLLSGRAMRARERRDRLAQLLRLPAEPLPSKTADPMKGILAEGNRDISRIHNPRSRDAALIEHCMRIEQHAITAYGIAVPLTNRIGFPRTGDRLRLLLSELESARPAFLTLETEVFLIAASQTPDVRGGTQAEIAFR